jgi:hypothetical protein
VLSTLAAVKLLLGVTDSSQDALLTQELTAADAAVKSYCKRDFEQASYTDYLSGNNNRDLLLRQRPVQTIDSVYEDLTGYWGQGPNAFGPAMQLTPGIDWVFVRDGNGVGESGLLRRIGGLGLIWPYYGFQQGGSLAGGPLGPIWRRGSGNVKVSYTAGYAPGAIPADLQQAVNSLTIWLNYTRKRGGYPAQSESLGDYSVSLAVQALSQGQIPEMGTIRQLLAKYRDLALGALL